MENQAHIGKMEAQLKNWGATLDGLVAKADAAGAEAKFDHRKRIDDLKAKHKQAQVKLEEFKTAGSEKLDTLMAGFEGAWNELEVAFKNMKN